MRKLLFVLFIYLIVFATGCEKDKTVEKVEVQEDSGNLTQLRVIADSEEA